jgi:hypothetical protein
MENGAKKASISAKYHFHVDENGFTTNGISTHTVLKLTIPNL